MPHSRGFEMHFGVRLGAEKGWKSVRFWKEEKCCWLLGRLSELVALRLST